MSNSFYVYVYRDSAGNPFYVGKGHGNRCRHHLHRCNNSKRHPYQTMFYRKLRKMARLGEKPIIEIILDNLTEENALHWEKHYIALWGRRDIKTGRLCNHSDGGEGPTGHRHSKETREKMSKARKISIIALDVVTGEDLMEFDSTTNAARFFDCSLCAINGAVRGRTLISAGCRWRYATEVYQRFDESLADKCKANKIPVIAMDSKTGEDLMEFDSATDAARFFNVTKSSINSAVRGKAKTSAGCRWRYA